MPNVHALYRLYNQYVSFKGEIQRLISNLEPALDPLNYASKSLSDIYTYNEKAADNGLILNNRNAIIEILNSLKNTILPQINRDITSLSRQIQDAEQAIALANEMK